MKVRSRELIVAVIAILSIAAYLRYRGDLKTFAGNFEQPEPVFDANGEMIIWSGEKPAGQTWANLGLDGKIDYPDKSGLNDSGKALTIRMNGDGYRGCGLNWKGWHPADACDDASRYQSLVFYIRQTTAIGDADLAVSLVDNEKRVGGALASNTVSIVGDGALPRIDSEWRKVVIPLAKFAQNRPLRLDRLWGIDFSRNGKGDVVFQIDRIGFTMEKANSRQTFPIQPGYRATVQIDLNAPTHRISDEIYGACNLPENRLKDLGIAVIRWGGNTTSRYNWKINADNGAGDWYFKNRGTLIRDLNDTGYLRHLRSAQAAGGNAYITVPTIGWVAKDFESFSYSAKKFGKQKEIDPATGDAGNGLLPDGSLIKNADPKATSIEVGPEFIEEAVAFAVRQAGRADGSSGKSGVKYWVLDNEPMLWHKTHRDVRSEPLSYDEFWERTVKYAEAIKKADPSAKVAGFCSWGWSDLFYSAQDEASANYSRPDHRAHGKEPLAEWFIRKCGEYKKKNGKTLVDVFDFHWYPQAEVKGATPYLGKGMNPALNELRLRSTRDLWDSDYEQESWIKNASGGQATKVIRRVRDWIERHNPGMEISVGEYNFGGGDNITGGLAQADVFGILAREKVDLAFIWSAPEGTQNLAWTLFRNYDDRGGRFGDSLIPIANTNKDLAIYAAKRRDGAVTIVTINKNLGGPCDCTMNIPGLKGKMRAWRFDQTSENIYEATKDAKSVDGTIAAKLPAASATIFVIK